MKTNPKARRKASNAKRAQKKKQTNKRTNKPESATKIQIQNTYVDNSAATATNDDDDDIQTVLGYTYMGLLAVVIVVVSFCQFGLQSEIG